MLGTFGKRFAHSKNVEVRKIDQALKLLSNKVFVVDKAKKQNLIDNLRFYRQIRKRVKHFLRKMTRALNLSGGQQQRLCIARAISIKPTILLMDEPCSALDPMATNTIENLIQEMKQAKKLSDSVIFFCNGKIVEFGSTQEIFENAQSPLTKEYILDH